MESLPPTRQPRPPAASQLPELVLLFVVLRLSLLFLFTPTSPFNRFSDFEFYYAAARLSESGYYPFINMWYEYPPLLAYLPYPAFLGARGLVGLGMPPGLEYDLFARLFGLVMLGSDAGSLVLIHHLARKIWGMQAANWMGWVYACLALPMFMLFYSHQPVVTFFTLLWLWLFVRDNAAWSGAALGLAAASKLFPLVLLAPALRFAWRAKKPALAGLAAALLVFAAAYLPFLLLGGGDWVVASFQALGRAGSYATLWALLDGNFGPGYYGPLDTRTALSQALVARGNPPAVPAWLVTGLFGAAYTGLLLQRISMTPRHLVWFSTLTLLGFHLWSKGWSPQWAATLIPFLLLSFPGRKGLVYILVLCAFSTTHWVRNETISAGLILARTLWFVVLSAQLVKTIWPDWRGIFSTSKFAAWIRSLHPIRYVYSLLRMLRS